LHPALLPHNRGAYPNVWSIIDGTPSGATLHYIDAGVDTGSIIAQKPVTVEPVDTGATLYRKLEVACVELFHESWPELKEGVLPGRPQPTGGGSLHRLADVQAVDEIDMERAYRARDLINLLRARTFPPHPGAFFVEAGKKVYVSIDLRYGQQP
jgi:methionyl-tRNA formyltransferase